MWVFPLGWSSALKCRIFKARFDCCFSPSHFLSFWIVHSVILLYYIKIILAFKIFFAHSFNLDLLSSHKVFPTSLSFNDLWFCHIPFLFGLCVSCFTILFEFHFPLIVSFLRLFTQIPLLAFFLTFCCFVSLSLS